MAIKDPVLVANERQEQYLATLSCSSTRSSIYSASTTNKYGSFFFFNSTDRVYRYRNLEEEVKVALLIILPHHLLLKILPDLYGFSDLNSQEMKASTRRHNMVLFELRSEI